MRKETFGMKKNLGSLLVDQNIITMQVLEEALQRQVIFGGRLGTNLMEMGAVKEETLLKVLASQHNVPFAEKHHFENILQDVLDSVPLELIEQHRIIPLKKERNKIVLAMRDPTRLDVIAEGVETKAHGLMLKKLGCVLAQGYGIARPMPAQDFGRWLKTLQVSEGWVK